MSKTHEELVAAVAEQYRAMAHGLKAQGPVLKNIDLTIAQLRTLAILAEDGPLVIGQIAQKPGIGLSTGGHLVDRLVHAWPGGAHRRLPEIARRTVVRLRATISMAGFALVRSISSHCFPNYMMMTLPPYCKAWAHKRLIGQKSRTVPVN